MPCAKEIYEAARNVVGRIYRCKCHCELRTTLGFASASQISHSAEAAVAKSLVATAEWAPVSGTNSPLQSSGLGESWHVLAD